MIENTEITAEKLEEIRQRYRPTEVPECHICGAEMTIQRMSASRITYGCAGAIYDETGCHYAEGRSLADDHYAESRITVVDVSDPDVLAMVEALEKAQQRITQLESRTVKLPDDEDGQAYGFGKWANRKLPATAGTMTIAYCEDAWRAAFEVFSSAAGIKVEAE
ncbi:ead/Ea22-like family protein [Klebsiella pneumoniae]|nr:ead/Ea22-like family protein [Klebsiella pneumoniae]